MQAIGYAAAFALWALLLLQFPFFTICATLAAVAFLALSNR